MKFLSPIFLFLLLYSCGEGPKKTILIFEEDVDSIVYYGRNHSSAANFVDELAPVGKTLNGRDLDTSSLDIVSKAYEYHFTFKTKSQVKNINDCFRFHLAENTDEIEEENQKRLPVEYGDIFIWSKKNKIIGWAKISFVTEDIQFKSFTHDYENEMGGFTYKIGIDYITLKKLLPEKPMNLILP